MNRLESPPRPAAYPEFRGRGFPGVNAEPQISAAIAESMRWHKTVNIIATEDEAEGLRDALYVESDDNVDRGDGTQEFWGPDDDDGTWRVHLVTL